LAAKNRLAIGHPSLKQKLKKPILGIIGGIGAGKSVVAAEFGKLGCAVIDADSLAHEVLQETATVQAVAARWGRELVNKKGQIDRSQLARHVFADTHALADLNALIHPSVLQKTEKLLEQYQADTHVSAIVLDMPLLMEVGWDDRCDRVVFVKCDAPRRVERMEQKWGNRAAEIVKREKVQISLDRKETRADNVIINNSDFATLVKQVTEIFTDMIK
jgi:dephospho-CoA kinase